MEGNREIKSPAKGQEMFNGYRRVQRLFVLGSFFVCGNTSKLNPVIITVPDSMVDDVP